MRTSLARGLHPGWFWKSKTLGDVLGLLDRPELQFVLGTFDGLVQGLLRFQLRQAVGRAQPEHVLNVIVFMCTERTCEEYQG